MITMIINRCA